jgi:hypothetical protein
MMSGYVARRLREEIGASALAGIFGPAVTLVPVPRSSLQQPRSLWPAQRICDALIAEGLASRSLPCLHRVAAVPKAAYASTGGYARPTPGVHFRSMTIQGELGAAPAEILAVDDVVTRGAQLLASVSLLREAFPTSRIRGFAIVRTMSFISDVVNIVDPCLGRIRGGDWWVTREP